MSDIPVSLWPRTPPKPRKEVYYRGSSVSMTEFRLLPHHCPGLPHHGGACCQMGLDHQCSQGMQYELKPDAVYERPYWVGKKPKP